MPRELRWQGQLFIFENVPMGVCVQCGEKVLMPEVAKGIDQILQEKKKPTKKKLNKKKFRVKNKKEKKFKFPK